MTTKHFLSAQHRANIFKWLEAGYGYKVIARHFLIPKSTAMTLRDIYRRGDHAFFGVGNDPIKRHYSLEFKLETVEAYYSSGLPLRTFARNHKLSPTTLRGWLARLKGGTLLK